MNNFDTSPYVLGKTLNLASAALKSVPRENLSVLLADSLSQRHGPALARTILESALRQLASA